MKRKARRWWIIGGAGLLLVVAAGVAFVFRTRPFHFLGNATLQNIEVYDLSVKQLPFQTGPGTMPASGMFTTRTYASELEFDEVLALAREELTPRGYVCNILHWPGETELKLAYFDKGDERVTLNRIPSTQTTIIGLSPAWSPLIGESNTFVEIRTKTNFFDRLLDKLHQDKLKP